MCSLQRTLWSQRGGSPMLRFTSVSSDQGNICTTENQPCKADRLATFSRFTAQPPPLSSSKTSSSPQKMHTALSNQPLRPSSYQFACRLNGLKWNQATCNPHFFSMFPKTRLHAACIKLLLLSYMNIISLHALYHHLYVSKIHLCVAPAITSV